MGSRRTIMAASITTAALRRIGKTSTSVLLLNQRKVTPSTWTIIQRNVSWKKFFGGSKDEPEKKIDETYLDSRKLSKYDGWTTSSRLDSLKKKTGLISVRGYNPPDNVEESVLTVVKNIVGSEIDSNFKLDDRMLKFQVLTALWIHLTIQSLTQS